IGLDPSPAALVHARRRHGLPLVLGNALALPFDAAHFDVVTCFDVLQHLPAGCLLQAAGELRRVLGPGGIALVRSNGEPVLALDSLLRGFTASGFAIRRASYVNCLPALAQELRARWTGPGRDRPSRRRGHPAGGGLTIRVPHPSINRLMGGVATAE